MELYYDVVCPYAYMAFAQLPALEARWGAPVELRPVLLGGLLRHVGGPDDPNAAMSPAKAKIVRRDIQRWADLLGVELTIPAAHPQRTVDAMRLVVGSDPGVRRALTAALFRAYWVDGADIRRREVLDAIAVQHGVDPAVIDAEDTRQALFDATAAGAQAGAFGVPTFVGGPATVWGQDRIGLLRKQMGEADLDLSAWVGYAGEAVEGAEVVFFHDLSSPFSYLAATQVERVAARHGATVVWKPILLGALFREIGTPDVPLFEMSPAKQAWVRRDLEHWAQAWDVPFSFPTHFPLRTVLPLRVALADPSVTPLLYRAAWAEDLRVDDPDALVAILDAAGRPGRALVDRATSAPIKAALRANTDEALTNGVCGVPTFVVRAPGREDILLWGQDRLVMLDAALQGWTGSHR